MGNRDKIYDGLNQDAFDRVKKHEDDMIVVNQNTGQVYQDFEATRKAKTRRKRGDVPFEPVKRHAHENGGFIWALFQREVSLSETLPNIDQSDLARILFLATYIAYVDSGELCLKYDNGRLINKSAMKKLLNCSDRAFTNFYKTSTDNAVFKDEGERILVNPLLFFKGSQSDIPREAKGLSFTHVFKKTMRELYNQFGEGRKVKQLGLIYSVLPFLNFKTNIIASNPSEKVPEYVKPMTLGELATTLGYKKASTLRAALNAIRIAEDKPVFKFVSDSTDMRTYQIIVNPAVAFGSSAAELGAIKALFN